MNIPGFNEEDTKALEAFLAQTVDIAARSYGQAGQRYDLSSQAMKDRVFEDLSEQVSKNNERNIQFMILKNRFNTESHGHLPHAVSNKLYQQFGINGYSHLEHGNNGSAFLAKDRKDDLYVLRLSLSPQKTDKKSTRVAQDRSRAMHTLQGHVFEIGQKMQGQLLPYGAAILEKEEIPEAYLEFLGKLYEDTCFLYTAEGDGMMVLPNGAPVFFDPGIIKYEHEADIDSDGAPIPQTGFYDLSSEEQEARINADLAILEQRARAWGLPETAFPYKNGEYLQDRLLPVGDHGIRAGQQLAEHERHIT